MVKESAVSPITTPALTHTENKHRSQHNNGRILHRDLRMDKFWAVYWCLNEECLL